MTRISSIWDDKKLSFDDSLSFSVVEVESKNLFIALFSLVQLHSTKFKVGSKMPMVKSILLFLEIVILIINLFGNSIVLYVMTRPQKLRRRSNFYIISITIANLLIGLFIVAYSIYSVSTSSDNLIKWFLLIYYLKALADPKKTHFFVCRMVCSASLFLFCVSYFSMVAVSIDRYFAIRHHLFYRKEIGTKFTLVSIAFCWIFGLIGIGPVIGWNADVNSCETRIFLQFNFVIVFCVFASFIPTLILLVLYGTIYKTIYDQVMSSKLICD